MVAMAAAAAGDGDMRGEGGTNPKKSWMISSTCPDVPRRSPSGGLVQPSCSISPAFLIYTEGAARAGEMAVVVPVWDLCVGPREWRRAEVHRRFAPM